MNLLPFVFILSQLNLGGMTSMLQDVTHDDYTYAHKLSKKTMNFLKKNCDKRNDLICTIDVDELLVAEKQIVAGINYVLKMSTNKGMIKLNIFEDLSQKHTLESVYINDSLIGEKISLDFDEIDGNSIK